MKQTCHNSSAVDHKQLFGIHAVSTDFELLWNYESVDREKVPNVYTEACSTHIYQPF